MIFKATAIASLLALAPAALAQDKGMYGDIGVSQINFDDDDLDFSVTMIQGRLGYDFNDYFGVEGELAFSLDGDTVNTADFGITPALDIDVDITQTAGIYGVLSTANTQGFEFFGRVGYVQAEIKGSSSVFAISEEGEGLAYGLGAKYYFDGLNGVRADFSSIEGETTNLSLAYTRRF